MPSHPERGRSNPRKPVDGVDPEAIARQTYDPDGRIHLKNALERVIECKMPKWTAGRPQPAHAIMRDAAHRWIAIALAHHVQEQGSQTPEGKVGLSPREMDNIELGMTVTDALKPHLNAGRIDRFLDELTYHLGRTELHVRRLRANATPPEWQN